MAADLPQFLHAPVLVDKVLEVFAPVPSGVVVDATIGGGGHAEALLDSLDSISIIGFDRDRDALEAAAERLRPFGDRVTLAHGRFDHLAENIAALGSRPVVGILFDLGVSSPQFDRSARGFSYRHEGPLDMRMDRGQELTADTVVNEYPEAELARILRDYADERYAGRIASAIAGARPVRTTSQLADVVRDAIPAPARRRGGHPARRTFQAIRIAVNQELDLLEPALDQAVNLLVPGGRGVVISYHSGEDRIVKRHLRRAAGRDRRAPRGLPPADQESPSVRLLKQGTWKPTRAEIEANPRSESARMRAFEKLDTGREADQAAGPTSAGRQ